MSATATAERGNPFKFLHYFDESDERRFAGREQELQTVTARIVQSHSFVLYGPSGSGKTSLMRAAVIPELERRGYKPVYVRMLRNPTADLLSAVATQLGAQGEGAADVIRRIEEVGASTPVVIILDQFEEFFIRFRGERAERERLIDLLGHLHRQRTLDLRLVFSLRQDYLGELDDFRHAIPELFEHEYRLRSLTGFGARQAIAQQLNASGVAYEPRFLVTIVDRLEPLGFDPTLLQLLCSEAYHRAEARAAGGEVRLTAADVEGIKDIDTLFATYLENFRGRIDQEQYLTAQALLDALISSEDTKRALTVDWLAEAGFRTPRERLQQVLDALVEAHLVRRDEVGSETWYELTHERLVDVVQRWLSLDEWFREYQVARDLVTNRVRLRGSRAQATALLTRVQVEDAVTPHMERLALDADQEDYVFRSVVLAQNPEVLRKWADRIGAERSADILAELLATDEVELQAGAALGAGWLGVSALRDECVALAVSSPDPDVRAAAVSGLAAFAAPQMASELYGAMREASGRGRAVETVARFHTSGGSIEDLGPWRRWKVLRAARRQQLAAHPERVAELRRETTWTGLTAAIAWTCTVGAFTSFVASGAIVAKESSPDQLPTFFMLLGIGFVVSLALGFLVGHRGGKAAIVAHLSSRPRRSPLGEWLRLGAGNWIVGIALFLVAAGVGFTGTDLLGDSAQALGGFAGLVVVIVGVWAFLAFAALHAAVAAPALEGEAGKRRWLWPILGGLGLVLVPALVEQIRTPTELTFEVGLVFVMAPAALLSCYSTVLLMVGDAAGIGRGPASRPHVLSRAILAVSVLLSVGYGLWAYGLDSVRLPKLARQLALGGPDTIRGELGFGPSDVDHFLLPVDSAAGAVMVTIVPQGTDDVDVSFAAEYVNTQLVLVVPPGRHWVSVYPFKVGSRRAAYELQLEPFPASDHPVLTDTTWQTARLRVPNLGTKPTVQTLSGTIPDARPGDMVEVIFPAELPWTAFEDSTHTGSFALGGAWSDSLFPVPDGSQNVTFTAGTAAAMYAPPGTLEGPLPYYLDVTDGVWSGDVEHRGNADTQAPLPAGDTGSAVAQKGPSASDMAAAADTLDLLVWVRRTDLGKIFELRVDTALLLTSEATFRKELARLAVEPRSLAGVCRRLFADNDHEHAYQACTMAGGLPASQEADQDVYALAGMAAMLGGARTDTDLWLDRYLEHGRGSRPADEYRYYAALRQDTTLRPKTLRWRRMLAGAQADTVLPLPAVDSLEVVVTADFDTVLELTSPTGQFYDNDDYNGIGSRLVVPAPTAGPWRVRVRAYSGAEGAGEYDLTVRYRPRVGAAGTP